jgi:hypothetical protein
VATHVKFNYRHKPVHAPTHAGSNRVGKQHRPVGDPVEYLKAHPKFEAVPFALPAGSLVMSLDTIAPGVSAAITKANKMVFHSVGDTGGINGTETQESVAKEMEQQIQQKEPGVDGTPAFFYHLGDVVYYNGISTEYPHQFYEPYQYYPANIFAIAGNHDGDTHTQGKDPIDTEPSLKGFQDNFCDSTRRHASPYRDSMTQPYVYWTLDTPLATIVGLYSNIDGSLDPADKGPQEQWLTQQLKDASKDKCLIVAVHHSPYSLDQTHGGYSKILQSLDNAIDGSSRLPDMVLSGHVHNYQRFSRKIGDREIPYIVAGAGGYAHNLKAMHQMQNSGRQFTLPYQTTHSDLTLVKFDQTDPGFLKITATASELTADYYIVPFEGPADGNPYDSVTVTLG